MTILLLSYMGSIETVREARGEEGPGARAQAQDRGGGRRGCRSRGGRLRLPREAREERRREGRRDGARQEAPPPPLLISLSRIT